MSTRNMVGLVVACGMLIATAAATGQEKAAFPVAVLNLDVLLKEDRQVVKALADLKQEAAEIEEKVKLRQSELEAVQNDLRKAQPGSAEQRRLQQEILKLGAELQQFVNRERGNVQRKEGQIYVASYRKIEGVVKEYCKEKGIKLVIREQAFQLANDKAAQDIFEALNRIVVFEDGLDITADIKQRLEAKREMP